MVKKPKNLSTYRYSKPLDSVNFGDRKLQHYLSYFYFWWKKSKHTEVYTPSNVRGGIKKFSFLIEGHTQCNELLELEHMIFFYSVLTILIIPSIHITKIDYSTLYFQLIVHTDLLLEITNDSHLSFKFHCLLKNWNDLDSVKVLMKLFS